MANSIINVRSPYTLNFFIDDGGVDPPYTTLWDITIKTGTTPTTNLAMYQFKTVNSLALSQIEIADIVKDYIINLPSDKTASGVWVRYDLRCYNGVDELISTLTATYLAFAGYGWPSEGKNPSFRSIKMMSTSTVYVPTDGQLYIPILAEDTASVKFYNAANTLKYTYTPTAYTSSGANIQYATYTQVATADKITRIDIVPISGTTKSIKVVDIDYCKFTPYRLLFINKYGAFEQLYFEKKSVKTNAFNREGYKANILTSTNTFSVENPQEVYNMVNGVTNLNLSTGWLNESSNDTINELMLSESVWIYIGSAWQAVTIKDSALKYKTVTNDKLINFNISVDFAHPIINNIR